MFGMIPSNRNAGNLFRLFDEFERDLFTPVTADATFRTDIRDEGDHYVLEADLPGFKKEDIGLDLSEGVLTITAKHEESIENKKDNYVCRERRYGSFSRSFNVSGIREGDITAAFHDGVLELNLPKQTPEIPVARRIEIQ